MILVLEVKGSEASSLVEEVSRKTTQAVSFFGNESVEGFKDAVPVYRGRLDGSNDPATKSDITAVVMNIHREGITARYGKSGSACFNRKICHSELVEVWKMRGCRSGAWWDNKRCLRLCSLILPESYSRSCCCFRIDDVTRIVLEHIPSRKKDFASQGLRLAFDAGIGTNLEMTK